MHNLIIDGKSLKDFGIYVSGENTYNAPAWEVETSTVPGRHGELLQTMDRLEPISVPYPAFIRQKFPAYAAQARLYLLGRPGWRRIEDDYHPDSYRLGYFSGPLDFDTRFLNLSAEMELVFTCQPQRWLKAGETPVGVTSGQVLTNDWMPAKPLIQITGTGAGELRVGSSTITILEMDGGLTIDCDVQNAYDGTINKNNNIKVSGDFPVLGMGETTVTYSGGITAVQITPRWWTI
ncbi:hypothetical protein H9X86_08760 [Pseudoflavonifractor capillosus]|uniref:hypothetical protein n=1 Tax=Pseudoflavonifractor capillosus TaxID=106588 RepID=UPI00195958DC|nr:hypothetical protein [Pseudoflavonifractor capillosus]MBM6897452.1 hypothetical protein [Pseudoflavonifractor capillosus]